MRHARLGVLGLGWGLALGCSASSSDGGDETAADPDDGGSGPADGGSTASTPGSQSGADDSTEDSGPSPPDVPPPQPTCTELPPEGEWEFISPPGTNGTTAFTLDPFDPAVLYASGDGHTGLGGIYRSDDCGGTWTLMSTGENGDMIAGGGIPALVADPAEPGILYTAVFQGPTNLWKSVNGGVDWTPLVTKDDDIFPIVINAYNWYQNIFIDPTDHLHLVAATHGGCEKGGAGCQIETFDGGETWAVAFNPENGGWSENGGALVFGPNLWIYGQPFGRLWITQDHGETWQDRTPEGGEGTTSGFQSGVRQDAAGRYYLGTLHAMMRSDDGLTWEALLGLSGVTVGLAVGDEYIFASDQWHNVYRIAPVDDPSVWLELPSIPGGNEQQGGVFLEYEPTHQILYSSNYADGLWRMHRPQSTM